MNNKHTDEDLRKQLDHYRRAFRDLNEALAAFFSSPDGDAFERLSRAQDEINARDE